MKRTLAEHKYKWDFSNLYKDKEEWIAELKNAEKISDSISKLEGKLSSFESFKEYLELDKKLNDLLSKMGQYLHLGDLDTTEVIFQNLSSLFSNFYVKHSTKTSFIDPEFKKIGWDKIKYFLDKDENLNKYNYTFRKFFKHSKYVLKEEQENLLSKVSRSRSAAYELYDTLAYADKVDSYIEYNGEKKELNSTNYLEIMENSDPVKDQILRVKAHNLFLDNFIIKKHSFAKLYEKIITTASEEVQIRNYKNILKSELMGDEFTEEMYFSLIRNAKENIHIYKEYLEILKNHYKLEKYFSTDSRLNLKLAKTNKYDIETSKKIIKEVLSPLGEEYIKNLELAWSKNRIDYYEDTNKRSGAYSSGGGNVDPIILMNWDYSYNSLNTLIHEIGHSVHTIFADQNQPYPLNSYPILLAEVASTMNEHLLFDYMYKTTENNDDKISLLQNRINDIIATFFRQSQFAEFEFKAHNLVENNKPLNAEVLSNLYTEISHDFGLDFFDKNDDITPYGWPRILHFFNSPFYVYKYATAITASFSLYNDIKNKNSQNLIKFLKSGGKKEPLLILKEIGIDFSDPKVYMPLLDNLKNLITELKKCLEKQG